ncbi:MAG TPA: hypothetical protein VFD06_11820 [Candidatus Polarisedimenticolia bacterium]|nr:hypothetical protein [Candidatus Polarisedimenticolia bacterium]
MTAPTNIRPAAANVRAIVARFADGRTIKGTTHDFAPDKDIFHVYVDGDESKPAVTIRISALKAIFFVKTYQGDSSYVEDKSFRPGADQGRRIRVIFKDKEEIAGFAPGSVAGRSGFFVLPVDRASNNSRIFIVHAAVAKKEFPSKDAEPKVDADATDPSPVAAAGGAKGRG